MMEEQELDPGDPLLNTGRFGALLLPIGLCLHCISNAMVLMNSLVNKQAHVSRQTETLGNSSGCYVQVV